jgi:uncharacterized protein
MSGGSRRNGLGATATIALAAALVAGFLVISCGRSVPGSKAPPPLTAAEKDSLLQHYAKDRSDTEEWLKSSPTSYLATVDRRDFGGQTSLTVGRASDSDVRIDDPGVKPHHLRVTVAGDSFHVESVDKGATFTATDSIPQTSAMLPPSGIHVARFALRLSHQRFPAIIVFDPKSPRYKLYKGMQYFPPDLDYRVVATLERNAHPDTTIILSTRGNQRRAVREGSFVFQVKGAPCRLEAVRLLEPGVGEKDLSLFFTDATTGQESYRVGRYLEPEARPDGFYILDFNMCYNPACAYSEHYNCPIPPKENHLQVAIAAGEMDAHYMH